MRASDVQQVVSQATKVEQMQQAMAHQAAAQQQAAAQKAEERRLEEMRRAEKSEARPGRSAVYNDERRDGGDRPSGGKRGRKGGKSAPEGSIQRGSGIDKLA